MSVLQHCFKEDYPSGFGALGINLEFFYFGQQHASTLR